MPEVIQDWLGTRLGILLDMTPQKFARNTKNGVLLAKLLYSYGVIPIHVLDKVKDTKNYYECYANLTLLKPWLSHIGVTHDESMLKKMAGGEGSAAISVFYAVYLNLERKDRLYYLSAQKERRYREDSCMAKFKVDWVPEKNVSGDSIDTMSRLALPLIENREMIDFHRERCRKVVESIKRTKEKFEKVRKKEHKEPEGFRCETPKPLRKRLEEIADTITGIDEFEKKHPTECRNMNYSELMELKADVKPCMSTPDMTEARNIVSNIKRRRQSEVYARNFHLKMQEKVLDDEWKRIVERQDRDFENVVCANLLKQSQYEKQMASKLYQMRNQKKVLAENRRKIECLKVDLQQEEYDKMGDGSGEMMGEYWEDDRFEKERIAELHRRMYDEKVRIRRKEIKNEAQRICESLIDIAIRVSEIREVTGCQIPKSVMKDMKELFFKGLSIFDLLDNFEELYEKAEPVEESIGEEVGLLYRNEEYERRKSEEAERQATLDECDFLDYIHLLGPWMVELLFPDGTETEVRHTVVGYIVHKLLAIKYPYPNAPRPVAIKPMRLAVVVLGLSDETACKMLVDLMEAVGVLVVRVEDAINFVLGIYKEELSVVRDIDISFQKATAFALKDKTSIEKEKDVKKKLQLLKKEEPVEVSIEGESGWLDKQTQTPRMIPEDDPLLSPNAEIGKIAFEALGCGDPVPDPAIVGAIVGYVASKQENYSGWVLLNYPIFYSQASELEHALNGRWVLPAIFDTESLEEIEGFSYREASMNPFARDEFSDRRVSRLVPKPDDYAARPDTPTTYFDSFIKMKKVTESPQRRSQDSEYLPPLEKFYFDQKVLSSFEYITWNFRSVKNLGKMILGEGDVEEKSSVEIFGEVVMELNEKWEPQKKKNGKDTAVKKVPKEAVIEQPSEEDIPEEVQSEVLPSVDAAGPPKPGDADWEWATGPQPENIQTALATLWENMEAVYIEDFKNIFFSLRVHRSNVLSYSSFIRRSMQILMRRPDDKQRILSDFQQMYNEIDEDLRPDADIKCELHVRVSELEQALMSIADERKLNSLRDLKKVAQDGWVADEMANLVNTYLSAVQLEADRCVDTCQVIMDYYISLQQKIPEEKPLGKVAVSKLQIKDRKYSIVSAASNKTNYTPRNSDARRGSKLLSDKDRPSKTRSWTEKRKRSSETSFLTGAGEVITEILVNLQLPDDCLTPFHNFFIDGVHVVTNDVAGVVDGCLSEAKKGDKAKNPKKVSETKLPVNENLQAEWVTGLDNELSRFVFRMKLILARGIFEMNEFLTTILNTLSSLAEAVTEMYNKEIQSISDCCKVFRCGIEEEIGIQPYLELNEDEFIVYEDVPLFPKSQEVTSIPVDDEDRKFRFSIEQLWTICQKLQRVAPNGEIIKRSFVYIIEDLRVLKPEVGNTSCFPDVWNLIGPEELSSLFDDIYQDLEVVHWKDFIIYAMDLPVPTESDILDMRRSFRLYDPHVTELITREDYDKVTFWFDATLDHYPEADRQERAKELLYKMYQVDEKQTNYSAMLLAFCKDFNPVDGFTKALALAMGKKIHVGKLTDDYMSIRGESDFEMFDDTFIEEKKPYCCPSSTEISLKCIPREKIVRCECRDSPRSTTDEEINLPEEGGEDASMYYPSGPSQFSSTTSVVPCNILSSLLKASYPSLPQLSVLLDCQQTFQETLDSLCESLEPVNDTVEVSRLLRHHFISRLLETTNKFRYVKVKTLLMSAVEFKAMTRSACFPDKLNVNSCMN